MVEDRSKFKWYKVADDRYEIKSDFFMITAWRDESDDTFSFEIEPAYYGIDSGDYNETLEELLESIDNSLDRIESDMSHLHAYYDDLKELVDEQ